MKQLSEGIEINKEITIHAPIDLVWYAWTISERVSEWFASEAIINPKVGGAYELYFIPGNKTGMNTKGCKITNLDEQSELHFTWKGPDQFASVMNDENSLTLVKVVFLNLDNNITKISLHHFGFGTHENWSEAIKWHDMAWSGVLSSLKSALEKGEGNLCCKP
ncbi:MAG: SRPBCC domain-containing protein [Psychrobacillus sp.]